MKCVAVYPDHGQGKFLSDFISSYSPELGGTMEIPELGSDHNLRIKKTSMLVLATKKNSISLKKKFLQDGWSSVIDYIEFLDSYEPSEVTRICEELLDGKPSITFKIPSNFKSMYGEIPSILAELGINVILLLENENAQSNFHPACKILSGMHPFFEYYMLKYSRLFIADDSLIRHDFCRSRDTPKAIHFLHATNTVEAFIDMKHSDEYVSSYYNKQIIPFFDYFFLPTKAYLGVYRSCIEVLNDGKEKWLAPVGSISLDRAIKFNKSRASQQDSILFIPTSWDENSTFYRQEYQSLPTRGFEIVERLLNEFPKKRVILRPHPNALHLKAHRNVIDKINSEFRNEQRYCFDAEPSYRESFERSALSISDCSSSAFTFSLSTSRPSITFQNIKRPTMHTIMGQNYHSKRDKLGPIVSDLQNLISETSSCLSNPNRFQDSINELRQNHYFNIGSVEENIAYRLVDLLFGKEGQEWIKVR